jgi:hypothetical protein
MSLSALSTSSPSIPSTTTGTTTGTFSVTGLLNPAVSGAGYAFGNELLTSQLENRKFKLDSHLAKNGAIQAVASLASGASQNLAKQVLPAIVPNTLGVLVKPAMTGVLTTGAGALLNKKMPPISDMALTFGVSVAADYLADMVFPLKQ